MPAALTLPELYDAHAAGLFHYFTGMVLPAFIGIRTGALFVQARENGRCGRPSRWNASI